MRKQELIEIITEAVAKELERQERLTEKKEKAGINTRINAKDAVIEGMKKKTTARIAIGKAGPRLRTNTFLKLRADHARAKDAVLSSVDESIIKALDLLQIKSLCRDVNEHLTRPDLGRKISEETKEILRKHCIRKPQVQIYASDGLSSKAIDENISDILPIMMDGLESEGIKVGTPFFLKYGRVPTMDVISEVLEAELTCVLIGERPGLAAADSMSAYITYGARPGIRESCRTVISNIHGKGIQPVEAGAYAVSVIKRMLAEKKSGVDFKV